MTTSNPPLTDPDLVDRIFDYILADPALAEAISKQAKAQQDTIDKLKDSVRAEFKGEKCYISGMPTTKRQERVSRVLALFNGRNATEVARKLGICRATVYNDLKQPGGLKPV
jgi:DNA-binding NarL/FixJ family response regulator